MNLLNLVKNLLNLQKKIDVNLLPSQGLFYKEDFSISIKRAEEGDILEYELNFIKDNIGVIIHKVKKVVDKNIILPRGYSFQDIKSIDVIFLFLEIVKFTKGKSIKFHYFDEEVGKEDIVEFSSDYFNYFQIDKELMKLHNKELACFEINGYRYSLPSIGIENCLTNFLIYHQDKPDSNLYNEYFYDFTYFLGDKSSITFKEIENLIQIFNYDIEQSELDKVSKILKQFMPIQKYSLRKNGKVIDINSKIDLEKIWK